ncbi:MAG: efflux RND transporter permease subunit [Myxococcota bacterium]
MYVEPQAPSRAARRLVALLARRAGLVVVLGLLLGAGSLVLMTRLEIDQDLKRLLPDDATSVLALEEVSERMGNQTDLLVAIESPSRDANIAFGGALTERLRARDDIRWAIFRQDRTFFEDHALLFLDLPDLLDLRDRVIERIRDEVRGEMRLDLDEDVLDGEQAAEDAEDEDELELRAEELKDEHGLDERLPEYHEAEEGRLMMLKARPTSDTTNVSFTRSLLDGVRGEIGALDPASFHPEMSVELRGAFADRAKDVSTIAGDAGRGSAAAAAVLILCLLLYFRRLRAVPLVMVPLLVSVLAALAYAELRYGYLNLVSAFIFAVLLGIGIDFGIHVLGRYEHERRRGRECPDALAIALSTMGVSSSAGGLGTACVYAVLMVADFQGFAQFGELAAVGILLAVTSIWTLLPAVVIVLERFFPWKPPRVPRLAPHVPPVSRRTGLGMAGAVVALGVAATAWASVHVKDLGFEYDFEALGPRPTNGEEADDETWREAIGHVNTLAPVVALTDDLDQTRWAHQVLTAARELTPKELQRLRAGDVPTEVPADSALELPPRGERPPDEWFGRLRERVEGEALRPADLARLATYDPERVEVMHRTLARVLSIFTFVPERQDEKLVVIRDIRRRIEQKREALTDETRERLDEVERYLAVDRPIGVEDLPDWVRVQLTDAQGKLGRFVIFRNYGSKADYEVSKELLDAFHVLPTPSGPAFTAGNLYVMPQMLDTVKADAPWVITLALLAVLLTALILFRAMPGLTAVVGAVGLAILWLLGLMPALGWKANFFNLVTFPLLLGMGQDDTLHICHRYREEGARGMGRVVRETGGAVFMTTVTTVIGFSGILFANHRGLLSFGWTAVVGMLLCWFASSIFLPAVLHLGDAVRRRRG